MSVMRYLLATLIAVTLLPSTASAALPTDRPQTSTRVTESLRIAREFWRVDAPVKVYGATGAALAAETGAVGAVGGALGLDIWLSAESLADNTYASRIEVCTSIVHEYGHALGIGHSTNRASVMFAEPELNDVVYGCWKRFMPKGQARRWRALRGVPHWLTR